jgi:hypothetical protein
MTKQDNTESARKAALKMLAAGIASPSEAGLDWRKARADALRKAWRKLA